MPGTAKDEGRCYLPDGAHGGRDTALIRVLITRKANVNTPSASGAIA